MSIENAAAIDKGLNASRQSGERLLPLDPHMGCWSLPHALDLMP